MINWLHSNLMPVSQEIFVNSKIFSVNFYNTVPTGLTIRISGSIFAIISDPHSRAGRRIPPDRGSHKREYTEYMSKTNTT